MKKVLAVMAVVVAISGVALAEGPCKAAREKFCKDVPRGGGAIMKCLQDHDKDLTPECRAKLAEQQSKMKMKQ